MSFCLPFISLQRSVVLCLLLVSRESLIWLLVLLFLCSVEKPKGFFPSSSILLARELYVYLLRCASVTCLHFFAPTDCARM